MRKTLTLCLISCFLWTACADHNGSLIATSNGPEAPINPPEDGLFPGDASGGSLNKNPGSGSEGNGSQGSTTVGGGTGSGSNGGDTGGGDTGGGDTGGGNTGIGGESGGSGGGGQPVPEPSTLLLVGTGLAGAALLRRRRKTAD